MKSSGTASRGNAHESEAVTRVNVAACYRLIHHYGLSDFTDGFASARIPDSQRHAIVGGYGLLPELARASALHRFCLDDEPQLQKSGGVDLDAARFTRVALGARDGINACIHAHTKATIALSALDVDLLPLSQWGIMYGSLVKYMDFTTTDVTNQDCCSRMTALLSTDAQAIVLRNHGVLVVGRTIAQAFFTLHRLELASTLQLQAMQAMQAGSALRMPAPPLAAELRQSYWTMTRVDNDGSREWPSLLTKLDGIDDGYRM